MSLDAAGRRALKVRVVVAPLLFALVGLVYACDRGFGRGRASAALCAVLGLVAVHEYIAMMRAADLPISRRVLLAAAFVLHASAFFYASWDSVDLELYAPVLVTAGLVFFLAIRAIARSRISLGLEEVGSTLLGFVLVSWPLYFAQGLALRSVAALLFVVLVAKAGDVGGYVAGVGFGRRKLVPAVSPGKSVEGALGSLLLACAVAVALRGLAAAASFELSTFGALAIGVLVNVCAQAGDLVESLLKRRCGAKDSSSLLPVHGGVLDLVDSFLFAVPAFFFVLVRFTSPAA